MFVDRVGSMRHSNLNAMLTFVAPYRTALALCTLLMLAESGMALAVPWLGGYLAESMFSKAPAAAVTTQMLLGLLILFTVQALLKFGNNYLLSRSSDHILADLRIYLYEHLQALPLGFYHHQHRGKILALLTNDVERLSGFISGTLPSVIPLLLTLTGSMVMMFRLDTFLALSVVMLVPLFYVVLKIVGRRLRPLAFQIQDAYAGAVSIAEENLGMLPAIKTFTREAHESDRYRRQIHRILHLSAQERCIVTALGPIVQFLAAAGLVLVLWLMNEQMGSRSPAEMVSFLLYATLLTRPVSSLADLYGQTRQASGALERLGQVLKEHPEPLLQPSCELPKVKGAIEFHNVSFGYTGRPALFNNIDLHIRAGETVAITGSNGAGKSTLAHLLMRLIEPSTGRVLIDSIDISTVTLKSLRTQIGLVQQHVLLFNGSVRDNIAYGCADADLQAITVAARDAQAHDFITHLPQGYDTLIGDQGIRLSGGQRQRIALARALLKNPPILVLDEATAMFDPEGEKSFIADCKHSFAHRTVILITHRPASLALADRVLRLEDGVISEISGLQPVQPIFPTVS